MGQPRSLVLLERARGWRRVRLLALVAILPFIWSLLAWGAARALIVRKELGHADTIAVLAGSSTYKERVRRAAQLMHAGRASRIVLTNDNQRGSWSEEKQENPFYVDLAREDLQKLGVAPQQIDIVVAPAQGTYHEARLLKEYAETRRLRSLLVVTSAYHSRRALWVFQRVFTGTNIDIGLETADLGQQTPNAATWWLYPRGWKMVPVEYVKLVYYRIRF